MLMRSRGMMKYRDFSLTIHQQTYIVFKVRSCRNVYILLGSVPGNDHAAAYEIAIGYKGNAASYIKEEIGSDRKHEVATPDILKYVVFTYMYTNSVQVSSRINWCELNCLN